MIDDQGLDADENDVSRISDESQEDCDGRDHMH